MPRADWLNVGMGLHHQYDGSEKGYKLFDRWSKDGSKYVDVDDTWARWRSFRSSTNGKRNPITFATVIKMVKAVGGEVISAPSEDPQLPTPRKVDRARAIPPRPIILHGVYIKGYLAGTAATGGSGKTSLVDVEVFSLALGVDLLNGREPIKAGAQKVLMISLEDDEMELTRRHRAIERHYNLTTEERQLVDENISVIFDDLGELKVSREVEGKVIIDKRSLAHIKTLADGVDVITIDPLVSIHESDENSNKEMQVVVTALRHIARVKQVAIHYVHHNRKGGGSSTDDMRGAVALRDGSRALRMVSRMTEEEAGKMCIDEQTSRFLLGVYNGKANFEPMPSDKTWYRLESVDLFNDTEQFDSDRIGVVCQFEKPSLMEGISEKQVSDAYNWMEEAAALMMRVNSQAKSWIGHPLGEIFNINTGDTGGKRRVSQILEVWEDAGCIKKTKARDPSAHREVDCYVFIRQHAVFN
jgi:hypothetical protein